MVDEEEQAKMKSTTLDLSKRQLKKVPKQENAQNVRVLILDENELQKIENIDSYLKIETLSLKKNQLLRMYGISRLHCLREINLSFNGLLSIEGLKDCVHLRHLNLEGNNIKTIEHLNTNIKLEYLNLADNKIGNITDISFLKCLRELHLQGNRLSHLRQCDKYLPTSLEVLSLAKNGIGDLNEICTLSHLNNLKSLSINDNPCVSMTGAGAEGFDHRPFVINWCMSVKTIDGFVVDPIESLKAEWLYSQGRGRQFRLGEQAALAKYLSSVCPLIGKALENENERKLRLILSKAQQHQRQLQEEISENSSSNNSPNSARKKSVSRIQSPRFSRLGRQGSPESMISSYHGHTNSDASNCSNQFQMTSSLIENIKHERVMSQSFDNTPISSVNPHSYNEPLHGSITNGPLVAASKMVPVPEALMSPDMCPTLLSQRMSSSVMAANNNNQIQNSKHTKNKDNRMNSPKSRSPRLRKGSIERSPTISPRRFSQASTTNQSLIQTHSANVNRLRKSVGDTGSGTVSSDDDSENINPDKLRTIHNKAAQSQQIQQNCMKTIGAERTESSAVVIQKIWRGYRTRKRTKDIAEKLLRMRTNEYIEKLTQDMAMTKAQMENERKIQQLQMQAISALWKKVVSMQENTNKTEDEVSVLGNGDSRQQTLDSTSTSVVIELTETCSILTKQVESLQSSMRDILNCLTIFCGLPPENVKKLLSAGINEAVSQCETRDSTATQTEIIAVHTPLVENFVFARARPSSLPLEIQRELPQCSRTEAPANKQINEN